MLYEFIFSGIKIALKISEMKNNFMSKEVIEGNRSFYVKNVRVG